MKHDDFCFHFHPKKYLFKSTELTATHYQRINRCPATKFPFFILSYSFDSSLCLIQQYTIPNYSCLSSFTSEYFIHTETPFYILKTFSMHPVLGTNVNRSNEICRPETRTLYPLEFRTRVATIDQKSAEVNHTNLHCSFISSTVYNVM